MTVTDFEKHVLEAAAAPGATDVPPAAVEEKVPSQAPAVPPSSRKFFLFFDFAFNNARGLVKAKTAALHFLDTEIRPDDEVGVLSYSMLKGVSVYEYLTRDHTKVREVLDTIGAKGIDGRASEMEALYWQLVQEPLRPSLGPETRPLPSWAPILISIRPRFKGRRPRSRPRTTWPS